MVEPIKPEIVKKGQEAVRRSGMPTTDPKGDRDEWRELNGYDSKELPSEAFLARERDFAEMGEKACDGTCAATGRAEMRGDSRKTTDAKLGDGAMVRSYANDNRVFRVIVDDPNASVKIDKHKIYVIDAKGEHSFTWNNGDASNSGRNDATIEIYSNSGGKKPFSIDLRDLNTPKIPVTVYTEAATNPIVHLSDNTNNVVIRPGYTQKITVSGSTGLVKDMEMQPGSGEGIQLGGGRFVTNIFGNAKPELHRNDTKNAPETLVHVDGVAIVTNESPLDVQVVGGGKTQTVNVIGKDGESFTNDSAKLKNIATALENGASGQGAKR